MPPPGRTPYPRWRSSDNAADITGIVLTKLDGTAKGGIVITIADEFNMPVKFVGLGEGIEDLEEFDPEDFAKGIFLADVILFMVDGKEGLTASDREVGEMLMKTGKKVVLAVNKIDRPDLPDDFYDFYELGLGEPIPISSANMLNLGDLLDEIIESFPEGAGTEEDESIKIAMIGKPNVGKSSLINRLLGENRVIVSPIAGTTRDSIDTPFTFEGEDIL